MSDVGPSEDAAGVIIELLDGFAGFRVETDEPMQDMRAVDVDGWFFDVRAGDGTLLTVQVTRAPS